MSPKAAKIIRFVFYSNWLSQLAGNKVAGYLFPGLVGLYYLTLDVWGNDWPIIQNHKQFHEVMYIWLVAATLVFIILKAAREFYDDLTRSTKKDVGKGLIVLTSRAVKAKLDRFQQCAVNFDPTSNTFKKITRPEDQIQVIISEIINFLDNTFEIDENEVCITIMHCDAVSKKWHYMFNTHTQWNHTKAGKLLAVKSMAALALSHGEALFHPDKVEASKKEQYFLSERDIRDGKGSAFCHPVVVNVSGMEFKFVISLITYGKMICNAHNPEQVQATKLTLRDICRRIELELTLWSMKSSLSTASPASTGGTP